MNLLSRWDYIFSFFKGCAIGEGLFLYRTMSATAQKNGIPKEEVDILSKVAWDLVINEYLLYDNHFFKLTDKGFAYMNKDIDDIFEFNIHLELLVTIDKDVKCFFNTLWPLIGKGDAPYYATGPMLFETFKSYNYELPPTYTLFIDERRINNLSTSRVQWTYELLQKLPLTEWESFLVSLSNLINTALNQELNKNTPPTLSVVDIKDSVFKANSNKTIFISYSHDSDVHKNWVKKMAEDLRQHFTLFFDQDIPLGGDIIKFMENINKVDKVLIIITPNYAQKANKRERGVGYESQIITADLYQNMETTKFIPILREGSFEKNAIVYLGMRKGLDMTNDENYKENLKILIDNI